MPPRCPAQHAARNQLRWLAGPSHGSRPLLDTMGTLCRATKGRRGPAAGHRGRVTGGATTRRG
eukprot:7656680-Alexandrium_andersonii.AAC.1